MYCNSYKLDLVLSKFMSVAQIPTEDELSKLNKGQTILYGVEFELDELVYRGYVRGMCLCRENDILKILNVYIPCEDIFIDEKTDHTIDLPMSWFSGNNVSKHVLTDPECQRVNITLSSTKHTRLEIHFVSGYGLRNTEEDDMWT